MRLQIRLNDDLQDYISDISVRESDLLRELREETAALPMHLMQVSPEQGQFLGTLVKATGARRTLEVGVFTGYSLLCTALALPDDGRIIALDNSETWTAMARRYCERAGVAGKVDLRLGDAQQTLAALLEEDGVIGSFDFAFIDANKEGYQIYYEGALRLLRPGGLVVVDNVLWHGAVVNPAARDSETRAVRAFNLGLRHDERVDLSLLPFADGMVLAVKR
jgi:predicted O-methyltransferase YrrM